MIIVHENVNASATRPMGCPNCNYKRAFAVPAGACVRKSKRGKPRDLQTDIALLKCKKCGNTVGISME